jgi:hypothetical protein
VVLANALEDNFRLYKMVGGQRKQIAGTGVKVASGQWHTLRVVAQGDHIIYYFNSEKLIDVQDATYTKGKVGLWTKADIVTAFTALTVATP